MIFAATGSRKAATGAQICYKPTTNDNEVWPATTVLRLFLVATRERRAWPAKTTHDFLLLQRVLGFYAEPWGLLELRLSGIENGELAARERKDSLVRAIGESRQRVGGAASDAGRRDSPRSLIWGRSSGE